MLGLASKFAEKMLSTKGQSIQVTVIEVLVIIVTLYVAMIVLGSLEPVMDSAINNTSNLATAKDSLAQNTGSAFSIGAIIPLIIFAMAVIGVIANVFNIREE